MDENSFDDLVKNKLGSYRDPGDDYGFDKLKARLNSKAVRPKYYGVAITAAALVLLFTGVNIYINIFYNKKVKDEYPQTKIDSLIDVVRDLKRQIEIRQHETEDTRSATVTRISPVRSIFISSNPSTVDSSVIRYQAQSVRKNRPELEKLYVSPSLPLVKFILLPSSGLAKTKQKKREISAKIKNELERHYFTGLGINIAPQAGIGIMSYSSSQLTLNPRIGVGADWIIGPRLSLETNMNYGLASHGLSKNDVLHPSFDDRYYGGPVSVKQIDNLLSGTVLFSYRQWLNDRDEIHLRSGFGKYISLGGKYNVKYSQGQYRDPDDQGFITQTYKNEGVRSFASMLSLGMGISRQINPGQKIEVDLYYERSLSGKMLIQMIGVRSSLWFKAR